MMNKHFTLLFFVVCCISISYAQEGVTITTIDGQFAYCFPDTTIEVVINVPDGRPPVQDFRLRWCDDCEVITIPGSNTPANQINRYPLTELIEENCAYN